MADEKTCCYKAHNEFREKVSCQFANEPDMVGQLAIVGDLTFCPFHLPYSTAMLEQDYGIEVRTYQPELKDCWSKTQIDVFNEDIVRRLDHAFEAETTCNLAGTIFPGQISFEGKKMPSVSFLLSRFAGGLVNFSCAKFLGGEANFAGAKFYGNTTFFNAEFSGGPAIFSGAQFSGGWVNFTAAKFSGKWTAFAGTQFSCGWTDFTEAEFSSREADFTGAKFSGGDANFMGTKFSGGPTVFAGVSFFGSCIFFNAEFSGEQTVFSGAHFEHDADFSAATSSEDRALSNIDIPNALFDDVMFSSHTLLSNRTFRSFTSFQNTAFCRAPEFHGSTLHQDTTFPSIENFRDTQSGDAAHAYRTLRLAMKQQEAHEEEAMFWALEQRSKRNSLDLTKPKNWFPWALSWGYDLLSEYGLNATRPLGWLVCWLLFYGLFVYDNLNATAACWKDHIHADQWLTVPGKTLWPEIWSSCERIVSFSIAQSARPFFIWSDYEGKDIASALGGSAFTFWVKVAATFDSAVSLTLVALFILAVRRRFRMQ